MNPHVFYGGCQYTLVCHKILKGQESYIAPIGSRVFRLLRCNSLMAPIFFCLGSDGVANVHPRVRRPGCHHQHQGILFCREKKIHSKIVLMLYFYLTQME